MRLSDSIALFIKQMLEEEERQVELQRNELAAYFSCSPSQINYVLSTRFSPEHGYLIESRRGGGGCIRIKRLYGKGDEYFHYLLDERIGSSIDQHSANILIHQLAERKAVSQTEAVLLRSAVDKRALSAPVPGDMKDVLRAGILRSMLTNLRACRPEEE